MKEPANDNQRVQPPHAPGPYEIRVFGNDFDPEIYSRATGEGVAHVILALLQS